MELNYASRVKVATALIALSVLASIVPAYYRTKVWAKIPPSKIALFGRRFVELRKVLPPRGVVGYIGDADEREAAWEYYQTQYFLTPTLLEQTSTHELVVGNFHHTAVNAEWLASHDLVLLRDFGDGIMLFSGKPK